MSRPLYGRVKTPCIYGIENWLDIGEVLDVFGGGKKVFLLSEIETRFRSCSVHSLVTIMIILS